MIGDRRFGQLVDLTAMMTTMDITIKLMTVIVTHDALQWSIECLGKARLCMRFTFCWTPSQALIGIFTPLYSSLASPAVHRLL